MIFLIEIGYKTFIKSLLLLNYKSKEYQIRKDETNNTR